YVLWELGHPLHAFDYDTVTDATIVVRRPRAGESFTTLDGQAHALDDSMLVIADPRRAIGIAGVMGGANTEVTDRTTRVLLESAWFSPVSIRRTARTLGLKTDAAYRFERGADIEALVDASARAAALIAELTRGVVARGLVDAYPRRPPGRRGAPGAARPGPARPPRTRRRRPRRGDRARVQRPGARGAPPSPRRARAAASPEPAEPGRVAPPDPSARGRARRRRGQRAAPAARRQRVRDLQDLRGRHGGDRRARAALGRHRAHRGARRARVAHHGCPRGRLRRQGPRRARPRRARGQWPPAGGCRPARRLRTRLPRYSRRRG